MQSTRVITACRKLRLDTAFLVAGSPQTDRMEDVQ